MKIKEITWQHRNDFHATMECEHCGHAQDNKSGYNDYNYHRRVIPDIRCKSCGKNSTDLNLAAVLQEKSKCKHSYDRPYSALGTVCINCGFRPNHQRE